MAAHALEKKHAVVGYDRSGIAPALASAGLEAAESLEDTREVRWAVEYALEREVWRPVIALAELALYRARDRLASKAAAVMRHEFGGHPLPLEGRSKP